MKTKAYLSMLYYDVLAWFCRVDKWSNLRKQSHQVYLEVVRLTEGNDLENNRTFWLIVFACVVLLVFYFIQIFVGLYLQVS